jgi:hypothetical protein
MRTPIMGCHVTLVPDAAWKDENYESAVQALERHGAGLADFLAAAAEKYLQSAGLHTRVSVHVKDDPKGYVSSSVGEED